MKRVFRALRTWFRGDRTILRRPFVRRRLHLELLEDRLTPTTDFRSVIGLDSVQSLYPYRGTGYTVAILDTGIDYNDTDLGGGFGAGHRVVAGYDFINNDADPMDDNGHGTHLAGIIGSSNPSAPGIAPNVNFVALKVLDSKMQGNWTAVDNALQWVIAHKTQYNIVDVNLSLGSGNYTSDSFTLLDSDFVTLKSMGVFTAVASGNNYYTYNSAPGLSFPAIDPNVVSVGATWAASAAPVTFTSGATESNPTVDHIVSFTQRSSALSILAPGAWITSDWLNNTTQVMGGTSMATAVISGAAVLLHQAYDATGQSSLADQSDILKLMQKTGVSIVDTNYGTDNVTHTGLTFKRLNLKAAMDTIGQPITPPTLASIATQTLPVSGTIIVPLSVSGANGPVTYTYRQFYLPAQAYMLDQQYNFSYLGSYYLNQYGANEKWILGPANVWYAILPNGELRRWAGSMAATLLPANLIFPLDATYYADPSKLWNAPYAGMPPTVFTLNGSNLSIRSPAYWIGTYQVQVTATDSHYSVSQTFNVNEVPANAPPVLAAIPNKTMAHSLGKLTIPLSATDATNDPITFSAAVLATNGVTPPVTVSVSGNQLTIDPAITFVGTFKVQVNASDGHSTVSTTFSVTVTNTAPTLSAIANQSNSHGTDTTVALNGADADGDALTYSAAVNPINGKMPALQVTVTGNQVKIHPTIAIIGTYTITATVSDGAATATRTFTVTLTNAAPTLAAIPAQTVAAGQTRITIPLAVSDPDSDSLMYQAVAETPNAAAYNLNQQHAFQPTNATYNFNLWGYNEKWLVDKNNQWYALLPNGKLQHWVQSITQTMSAASTVTTFDPSFYAEPRLLWNAAPPTVPALTFAFQGNQLTIQRPANLTGVFFIDLTVGDGWQTAKRTVQVTLN